MVTTAIPASRMSEAETSLPSTRTRAGTASTRSIRSQDVPRSPAVPAPKTSSATPSAAKQAALSSTSFAAGAVVPRLMP